MVARALFVCAPWVLVEKRQAHAVPLAVNRDWRGGLIAIPWAAAAMVITAACRVSTSRSGIFGIAAGLSDLLRVLNGNPPQFRP